MAIETGCIYAQKTTFANRYWTVKLFCLTGTPTPYGSTTNQGGLAPHRPREEKNGDKLGHTGGKRREKRGQTRPYQWRKQRKNAPFENMVKSGKKWQNSKLQLQKPLYIFCNCRTGKVSYVCGG